MIIEPCFGIVIRAPDKKKGSKKTEDKNQCFKMHQGFCLYSGTMRPTGQEIIATGKTVCYSQFPRGGCAPEHSRPPREPWGQSGGRREGKKEAKAFIVVFVGRNG